MPIHDFNSIHIPIFLGLVSGGEILSAMNEEGGSIPRRSLPSGAKQAPKPSAHPWERASSLHSNEPAGQTGAGRHGHGCLLLTVSALAADGCC